MCIVCCEVKMSSGLNDMVTSILLVADGSCLCKVVDGFVFLISTTAASANWKEQSTKDVKNASGLDIPSMQAYKWFKVVVPVKNATMYVTSIVFQAMIPTEEKQKAHLAPGYSWITPNDMRLHYERRHITNPIIFDFFPKLPSIKYDACKDQFNTIGIVVEVAPDALEQRKATPSEMLIQKSAVMQVQKALFRDFYTACMPSILMSQYHFVAFMRKFGFQGAWLAQLFKAADFNNNGFITYRDLARLIAVVDPTTVHTGQAAEMRKQFLFRMFDTDNDLALNRQELEALVQFVRLPNDPDVRTCVEKINKNNRFQQGKKISFDEFSKNIDYLRNAVMQTLRATRNCSLLYSENAAAQTVDARPHSSDFATRYRKELETRKTFALSSHTMCITKSGTVINIEDVWGLKNVCSYETLKEAGITRELRKLSCELNSPNIIYNDQITNLRYLAYLNKIRSGNRVLALDHFDWGTTNSVIFGSQLLHVCTATRRIVMSEKRLLELKPPTYIIGSVHGNFGDLLALEKVLWPRGLGHSLGSILFLGGYVDRVQYGIEVINFLFCYKNLFPTKVYMLRGCHEIRKIQVKDCFQKECLKKFGPNLGMEVWEAVNAVFDCLPVAAVIGNKLLCVHSGIPQPLVCTLTQFFNNIPLILADPEKSSVLAWELFWNEPAKKGDNMGQVTVEGFAKNTRRGTGYTFSPEALQKFLDTNFYTHLIRTNDPIMSGYTLSNKGHLITVFTSSQYNDLKNDSSCLLVDRGKIRAVRLQAEDNKDK